MTDVGATFCNPLNLSYRFQIKDRSTSHREAADPSVVAFDGELFLFASKSGGYWHTSDMRQWAFVPTAVLPTEDYAPDVRVIDGALHFTASRGGRSCPIYRSVDPKRDAWEHVCDCFTYWDPNLFQDDDGQVYLYYGCSDRHPLRAVRLDRSTLQPVGEHVDLIVARPDLHGWERCGENNRGGDAPWIEGAWMTEQDGVYYLQYAAPGTSLNVYGDGVYTSTSPLGPFQYAPHNPFSFKPGGFITGAGHGSCFHDRHGNLWHAATLRISVKHMFERRIGLFPAGFDADGVLFCNTLFGDYPMRLPTAAWDPWTDPFAGWMLLSYRKSATASSDLPGYGPGNAFDEDVRTYWAGDGGGGQWLQVDLHASCRVNAVQINFAEHDCAQWGREGAGLFHRYLLEWSVDGTTWEVMTDRRHGDLDRPHDYVELPAPVRARHVRLTIVHMPGGGACAVSGLRIFGRGDGAPPAAVRGVEAVRCAGGGLSAHVRWEPADGAEGYNVRWGIAPDKLYSAWMVYDQHALDLRALNAGVDVFLAVDAFNANGVTPGAPQPIRPAE